MRTYEFLDLVAEKFGTTRRYGETDEALRARLEGLVALRPNFLPSRAPEWPPVVVERMRAALHVLDTASSGGYFDKWLNAPGDLLAHLIHCASAATALLNDPCLEVRMLERRDGPALELQPRWEGWRVEPAG